MLARESAALSSVAFTKLLLCLMRLYKGKSARSLAYFTDLLMAYLPRLLVLREMHKIELKNEQKQGDKRKQILFLRLGMAYLILYASALGYHG
jgi:hypothetical protein